jgi:tetratricopeptide (TPR) repeat protein
MRQLAILATAGLAAMALTGAAHAADSSLEEARQHAAQAKVHYDLNEFEKAAEEYILVYRLRPLPALLFNIAQSYRQAGQYEKAKQFYQSYLREDPDPKTAAAVRKALKEIDDLQIKERQAKNGPPTGVKQASDASLPIRPSPPEAPPAATPGSGAIAKQAPATTAGPGATSPSPAPAAAPAPAPSKGEAIAAAAPAKGPATTADSRAAPAVSRPSTGIPSGYTATNIPQAKSHTLRWVAVGATAVALAAGGAFGAKTLSSRSPDDAKKANLMYGIGGGLAAVTGAMFLFDF